jgi:hypothetical protein
MIGLKPSALNDSKPHEFLMRFVFGGVCTAAAGLIAKKFGPGIGGLFLAFPAIFPASASLIEAHEENRKKDIGMNGTQRGRQAAAVDAAGAALGAIGLIAFAVVIWRMLEGGSAVWVIAAATIAWALTAVGTWWTRRALVHRIRRHGRRSEAAADGTTLSGH